MHPSYVKLNAMRCPGCGQEIPAGGRFCPNCGIPIDPHSLETRLESEPVPEAQTAEADSSESRFLPGHVIAGRYRIVSIIGRGGMGEVYRADDLKLGQTVALKFLPPGLEQDPDRLSRLLQEVKIARQVTHANVCRVFDLTVAEGQHFLSMEFIDGENLAALLQRIGRLPREKASQLARQMCAGLDAAHCRGILHRDLKPANIMIDGRGRGATRNPAGGRAEPGGPAGRRHSIRNVGLDLYVRFLQPPCLLQVEPGSFDLVHGKVSTAAGHHGWSRLLGLFAGG